METITDIKPQRRDKDRVNVFLDGKLFSMEGQQLRFVPPGKRVVEVRSYDDLKIEKTINIKPGRVGGFEESQRIHELMRAKGLPVWCGGMLESGIGRAHNLALASLPGFTLPGDISASRRYWEKDIVAPEFEIIDGLMVVPSAPGIGVEIDVGRIEALTVRQATLVA